MEPKVQNGTNWISIELKGHQQRAQSIQNRAKIDPKVTAVHQKAIPPPKTMVTKGRRWDVNPHSPHSARSAFFPDLCRKMINLGANIDAKTHQKSIPQTVPKRSMTNMNSHDFDV